MRFHHLSLLAICASYGATAQTAPETVDPLKVLASVSETYAANPDTFHMESIIETTSDGELKHDWRKVYRTAIKGPGSLYRIETRSPFGSYIQLSDGKKEWVYLVEAKAYTVRPLPENWPQLSNFFGSGAGELTNAWTMRVRLDAEARGYKHARMLPEETIIVEGKSYPCYVIHVTSDDAITLPKENHWEKTFWVDKSAHVFRKEIEHNDSFIYVTQTVHTPYHSDTTTVFPVADFDPHPTPETFSFTPPEGAKQVASLEPDLKRPEPPPLPQMVGTHAPEISFAGADGSKMSFGSFRGKPLLIDLWATWCGPCLLSLPSLSRIDNDFKGKGLVTITFDQDEVAATATEYLARHHFTWQNFHDAGYKVSQAFQDKGIPLTILLDSEGRIVYYGFGGEDDALRKAIAGLGPEFASTVNADRK